MYNTILDVGDTAVYKIDKNLCPRGSYIYLLEKWIIKQDKLVKQIVCQIVISVEEKNKARIESVGRELKLTGNMRQ